MIFMKIYLASSNRHKLLEFQSILKGFNLVIPDDNGILFSPEETGETFFENALIKAKALYEIVKEPVIADDSGLCINALNGAPGIYSARYGSLNGKNTSADTGINKVLEELSNIISSADRKACFVCCIVIYLGENRFYSIQETCEGEIAYKKFGKGGFGYDPIFYLPQLGKTMAELTEEEKNKISHRGKAVRVLSKLLRLELC